MNNNQNENPNLWNGNDECFVFASSPAISRGRIVDVFPMAHMQFNLDTVVELNISKPTNQNPNLLNSNDVFFEFISSPTISRGRIIDVFPMSHMQFNLDTVAKRNTSKQKVYIGNTLSMKC
jgi:hypothetical protein